MTRMLAQQLESGARPAYSVVGLPLCVRAYLSQPIALRANAHKRQAKTEYRGRSMR
jgi:hypothetical protein